MIVPMSVCHWILQKLLDQCNWKLLAYRFCTSTVFLPFQDGGYLKDGVEEECIYESVSLLVLFLIQSNQCSNTNGLLHHKVEIIMLFMFIVLRKASQILYIKQQIICQTTDTHHTTSFTHQYLYKNM